MRRLLRLLAAAAALAGPPALAETPAARPAAVTAADLPLLDRHGRERRLPDILAGSRVVAINFIFGGCATLCPVSVAVFRAVQDALGERLGREVALVTLTVDPLADPPERLREMAAAVGAADQWLWLTGSKANVDAVLRGLRVSVFDVNDHPPITLVGDPSRRLWLRLYGAVGPDEVLSAIGELRQGGDG